MFEDSWTETDWMCLLMLI